MVKGAFEDAALETPLAEDGEETPVRIPLTTAISAFSAKQKHADAVN
jgi:hypothetical protein